MVEKKKQVEIQAYSSWDGFKRQNFDATRFRTSFLFIAKELNAEVMPVQIDYENEIFNILESFNIEGDTESVVKNLRLKFNGIKGKRSRFKA